MAYQELTQDERLKPFTTVLRDVAGNIQSIIRAEVRLAKTEIKEEATVAGGAAALGAIAAGISLLGLGFVFAALAFGLALVMPAWFSCLLIGIGLLLAGGFAALIAWSRFRNLRLVPLQTTETLEENAQWLRNQAR